MSYYPTERREGCMESITRCCRQAYVYPLDTRKLLYGGGVLIGIILIAVIWTGLSSSSDQPGPLPLKGSSVLREVSLIVGSNFLSENLRDIVHNNISRVDFNKNLSDSIFENATYKSCQTNIPRLQSGLVGSQIWSLRVPCDAMYKDAVALTLEQVDTITRLMDTYQKNITIVKSSDEIVDAFKAHQLGGLLGISSGHSIDGRMPVLRTLYNLGVRVVSLSSNCSTSWAASYGETNETFDPGLSDFGKALVREMNRLGVLIDLSETSHETQKAVLNISRAPVIFSHVAAYGLVPDSRNVKDDVLQQLKINGGIAMVTFVKKYISSNTTNATLNDVINILLHLLMFQCFQVFLMNWETTTGVKMTLRSWQEIIFFVFSNRWKRLQKNLKNGLQMKHLYCQIIQLVTQTTTQGKNHL